jgi:hypothetical protein
VRTIQVRPSRNPRWQTQGGWEVYEAEGVSKLGAPDGYRQGEHGEEMLRYSNRISTGWSGDRGDYYVTLRNGVVVEYGAEQIRPGQKPVVIVPMPPIQ